MDFVTYRAPPQPIRSDKSITVHGGRIVPGALLTHEEVLADRHLGAERVSQVGLVVAVYPRVDSDMLEQVDVLWSPVASEVLK